MHFHIITIFPDFFAGPFDHGVIRRARTAGRLQISIYDLRNWTYDRHKTVDDRPFGGGEGMLLKPQPILRRWRAFCHTEGRNRRWYCCRLRAGALHNLWQEGSPLWTIWS